MRFGYFLRVETRKKIGASQLKTKAKKLDKELKWSPDEPGKTVSFQTFEEKLLH